MPIAPRRLPRNTALTTRDFNAVAAAARRAFKLTGGRGMAVTNDESGITIATSTHRIILQEPAQVALAKNIGTVGLNVLDVVQIAEPIQLQDGAPAWNTGTPIDKPYVLDRRVLEVYKPTDTSFGRFAVCAQSMAAAVGGGTPHPGRIGKVWVAGVCLCRLDRSGEWHNNPRFKTRDRADTRAGQTYLQLSSLGAAQVLWVWNPMYPGNAEAPRLAAIRFASRNTDGVGTEYLTNRINAGTAEVFHFSGATVTRLREAIVRVTP